LVLSLVKFLEKEANTWDGIRVSGNGVRRGIPFASVACVATIVAFWEIRVRLGMDLAVVTINWFGDLRS
jgi:hypothetical protein